MNELSEKQKIIFYFKILVYLTVLGFVALYLGRLSSQF